MAAMVPGDQRGSEPQAPEPQRFRGQVDVSGGGDGDAVRKRWGVGMGMGMGIARAGGEESRQSARKASVQARVGRDWIPGTVSMARGDVVMHGS